jgi:hypothetical protein
LILLLNAASGTGVARPGETRAKMSAHPADEHSPDTNVLSVTFDRFRATAPHALILATKLPPALPKRLQITKPDKIARFRPRDYQGLSVDVLTVWYGWYRNCRKFGKIAEIFPGINLIPWNPKLENIIRQKINRRP